MFKIILLLVCRIVTFASVCATLVVTTTGPIQGRLVNDLGVRYLSFQGIPYAESPSGALRFRPPVPRRPWIQILNATRTGKVCVQPVDVYKKEEMSEDCLFLNIYVPANRTRILFALPVYVHIHGGQFLSLSGNDDYIYGPQLLLRNEIIVVTLNYRLGALGFLSFHTEDAPGNAGLKDIILALQWIKANIARFGGDPNKITLGGNSAGAAAAQYLMLSRQSTGLFQRALLISGSAFGTRFLDRYPIENANNLAKQLNISTNNTSETLRKLKEIDAFEIVKAQSDMGQSDNRKGARPFAPFVPSIEMESNNAIITRNPIDIVKSGIPQNVPTFAGFNSEEGIAMLNTINKNQSLVDQLNENFELCIPSYIEYPYGSKVSREVALSIQQFYFNGQNITNSTLRGYVGFIRESHYSVGVNGWIKLHKKRQDSNRVYYYLFDFDGELNWSKVNNKIDFPGTAHADELGYLFATRATSARLPNLDIRSQNMLYIFTTALSNFVKVGNPTPTEEYIGVIWPQTDVEGTHLILNDNPINRTASPPIPGPLLFWQNAYDRYAEYLNNGGALEPKIVP